MPFSHRFSGSGFTSTPLRALIPVVYRHLRAQKIQETTERLRDRVVEHFPKAGLRHVADELTELARTTGQTARRLGRPIWLFRIPMTVLLMAVLGGLATVPFMFRGHWGQVENLLDFVQILEPTLGALFFLSALVAFLYTAEERYKRRRILTALHELRVLAHIVDMHQVTKDPSLIRSPSKPSPARYVSTAELSRYLDYCSEMLAMISKLAALYVQEFPDPQTISAVDEIEGLTTGLSRKIWQKVMVLNQGLTPASETGRD